MKRAKLGVTIVTVLAVPIALAAEWATDREAATEAKTALVTGDTMRGDPRTEKAPDEIRIYPSF